MSAASFHDEGDDGETCPICGWDHPPDTACDSDPEDDQ